MGAKAWCMIQFFPGPSAGPQLFDKEQDHVTANRINHYF